MERTRFGSTGSIKQQACSISKDLPLFQQLGKDCFATKLRKIFAVYRLERFGLLEFLQRVRERLDQRERNACLAEADGKIRLRSRCGTIRARSFRIVPLRRYTDIPVAEVHDRVVDAAGCQHAEANADTDRLDHVVMFDARISTVRATRSVVRTRLRLVCGPRCRVGRDRRTMRTSAFQRRPCV